MYTINSDLLRSKMLSALVKFLNHLLMLLMRGGSCPNSYLKVKIFFAAMLPVKVFILFLSLLYIIVTKSQVQEKNQHKTIIITICKTKYRESKSRFCCYAGNKTNSAAKLGT